jgi:RNA polymerase sigma-70 factor (ECF subfamily)
MKRKIIDYYRKKSTQSELNILDNDKADGHFFNSGGENAGHWNNMATPKEWTKDSSEKLESEEFYAVLKNCLGKLPEKWAAVFSLKNMDDLDSEEICKELQITSSNYWVLMHRAKLQLRECLEINWLGK